MNTRITCLVTAALLLVVGCGGGTQKKEVAIGQGGTAIKTAKGVEVSVAAHNYWQDGLKSFDAAKAQGWNDGRCDAVADKFEEAADAQGGKFAEAYYMAGLAHSKCKRVEKARQLWDKSLRANEKFCKARVALGVEMLESGREGNAEREFERSVRDDPQCTEGYVNLAVVQQRRGNSKEALNNLRRALAIDSNYLPAFAEMALLYLNDAVANDNTKALDLAEVVLSQAQKIDKNYPALYNTWGLVDLRRGEIIEAAAKFQRAAELDSEMFEAHMNFARITIGFRGYEDARKAYAKALELQPKNFDAQLGIGVAYRGLEQNEKAEEAYKKASALDGRRPEPYYNLGVLYQDFMGGTEKDMNTAKRYYDQFLSKAGSDQKYAAKVEEITTKCKLDKNMQRPRGSKCVLGRLQNIEMYHYALKEMDKIEKMKKEAEVLQREAEEQEKAAAKAAEEQAKKDAEAAKNAPPPEEPKPEASKPPEEEKPAPAPKPAAPKKKAPAKKAPAKASGGGSLEW